jgi:hypothetical protein
MISADLMVSLSEMAFAEREIMDTVARTQAFT